MYIKAELRHEVRDTMVSDDTPMEGFAGKRLVVS